MIERKYIPHISDNRFSKLSCPQSIEEVLVLSLGYRDVATKNYEKSEHKWNK